MPTFAYKLVAFVVSAFFTALGGGLYALWFGDLDPIFQFSILVGSYMVLMALLGGVRTCSGRCWARWSSGTRVEYFKVAVRRDASSTWSPRACCWRGRAVHARRRHPGRHLLRRPVPAAAERRSARSPQRRGAACEPARATRGPT